jgi:8-oxo-dGTP pyrophosphatase MutT (NUDIX family)
MNSVNTVDSVNSVDTVNSDNSVKMNVVKSRRNRCFGGILYYNDKEASEQKYLLVKGRQTGIWSFPKGHSNRGESSLECAKREIHEETGIYLHEEHNKTYRLKGGVYFVFGLTSKPEEDGPVDKNEIEETRWMTKEEMSYCIVNSGVKDFLQRNIILIM